MTANKAQGSSFLSKYLDGAKFVQVTLAVIIAAVTIISIVFGSAFDGRIRTVETISTSTQSKLEKHVSDNYRHSSIRTEKDREKLEIEREKRDQERWTSLFREINQMNERLHNLERRGK